MQTLFSKYLNLITMAKQTEAIYYTELQEQDVMISALGTPNEISEENAECWGRVISWEDVSGGSVDCIKVSYDDGASWRAATAAEFKELEKEAQEKIDDEAFEEVYQEL